MDTPSVAGCNSQQQHTCCCCCCCSCCTAPQACTSCWPWWTPGTPRASCQTSSTLYHAHCAGPLRSQCCQQVRVCQWYWVFEMSYISLWASYWRLITQSATCFLSFFFSALDGFLLDLDPMSSTSAKGAAATSATTGWGGEHCYL